MMHPLLDDESIRENALDILRTGGVIVLATDTLPGFAAAASSSAGVARIALLKEVTEARRYVLLASSIDMVAHYASSFGCVTREDMETVWPAPVTVVLPAGDACPRWCGDTVAFRVPDDEELRGLIEELGEPIVSTSVNVSGEPALSDFAGIEKRFGASVDLIVASGREQSDTPSTIVDVTGEKPHVIRAGGYAWAVAGD